MRKHFPKQVLNTVIPRSVRISEAPSYGQSVISYDPNSPGALSYLEAAGEIARRGAAAWPRQAVSSVSDGGSARSDARRRPVAGPDPAVDVYFGRATSPPRTTCGPVPGLRLAALAIDEIRPNPQQPRARLRPDAP